MHQCAADIALAAAVAAHAAVAEQERHAAGGCQVVQHVLGMFDYRLRVVARDIADFERVLRQRVAHPLSLDSLQGQAA